MPKHPRSNDLLPSSLQESAAIPLPTWSSASECAKRLTQRPELASKHLHKQKRILPFQSENLTKSFALKKTQNFKSLIFRPPPFSYLPRFPCPFPSCAERIYKRTKKKPSFSEKPTGFVFVSRDLSRILSRGCNVKLADDSDLVPSFKLVAK